MKSKRFRIIVGVIILVVFLFTSIFIVTGGLVSSSIEEEEPNIYDPTPQPNNPAFGAMDRKERIADEDGMTLVFVDGGEFEMGSENGGGDESPVHKVHLDSYWIDKTEVTNAMFSFFTEKTGYVTDGERVGKSYIYLKGNWEFIRGADWQHPEGPESDLIGLEHHPVTHISWNDATTYCSWAGRRLPSAAEWELAARGLDGWIYPWGEEINSNFLNFDGKNGGTLPVGSYPDGASPYGALDMAGNVWEWVGDWYSANYYENSQIENPRGPESGQFRELRGGSWGNSAFNVRPADRNFNSPDFTFIVNGFRCAASP